MALFFKSEGNERLGIGIGIGIGVGAGKVGGKMELLKLSRFKLQLQALITEVRELREKERASSFQLHNFLQKQKQSDEEFTRKFTELEVELASSNELRQKLERKVQCLENENSLLESKQKELKGTISSLLQSKEGFIRAYEESTCEMKRSIQSRDRKIAMLSEKINAHLSSLGSIQKEASFVKQVVDNAQRVLNEKEQVVAQLRIEVDKISAFEKLFIETINDLKTKLRSNDDEFRKKDMIIAELQTQLETAKISDQCQSKIEELQETLQAKEGIIQTLISENNALHSELGRLEFTLKKIQDTVTHMDAEDKTVFSLMVVSQEQDTTVRDIEDNRTNADGQTSEANCHHETSWGSVAEIRTSTPCEEYLSVGTPLRDNHHSDSCMSEFGCSPLHSLHPGAQPAADTLMVFASVAEDNCTALVQQLDSECSTTQAGNS